MNDSQTAKLEDLPVMIWTRKRIEELQAILAAKHAVNYLVVNCGLAISDARDIADQGLLLIGQRRRPTQSESQLIADLINAELVDKQTLVTKYFMTGFMYGAICRKFKITADKRSFDVVECKEPEFDWDKVKQALNPLVTQSWSAYQHKPFNRLTN